MEPPETVGNIADALNVSELDERLAGIAGRVRSSGARVAVQEGGETVLALVPAADLELLEEIEDRLDLLDALDALADYRLRGGVPLEDLRRDLGD